MYVLFCVMQLVRLCSYLIWDTEGHYCADVNDEGVISTLPDGDACQDTGENVCQIGMCEGNKTCTDFFFNLYFFYRKLKKKSSKFIKLMENILCL